MAASLEGVGLAVDFAGLRALDNVNIELQTGEILGLIGPNGSGKTTLVNVLSGQLRPTAGRLLCQGEDVTRLAPPKLAQKGVARSFQIVRVFAGLTVRENVEVAAVARRPSPSRRQAARDADELLSDIGLTRHADDLAGTLSYGDKRRVEIARALASQPRFLLLDEPAAGMNDQESEALLDYLRELPARYTLGLLIIDHDMPLIMRLCQRLQVLASGRTIAEGSTDSVRHAPQVIEAYLGSASA